MSDAILHKFSEIDWDAPMAGCDWYMKRGPVMGDDGATFVHDTRWYVRHNLKPIQLDRLNWQHPYEVYPLPGMLSVWVDMRAESTRGEVVEEFRKMLGIKDCQCHCGDSDA